MDSIFTVHTKSGIRYGATIIMQTIRDGDGEKMISFVCSGIMTSIPVSEVKEVTIYIEDAESP